MPELTYGKFPEECDSMQRRIRVPDEQTAARNDRIRRLYEEGASILQIAQVVEIHPTTAWRVLAKAGVVRPQGWKQRQQLTGTK
jgi:DNA invertase Pin-like site-specific DNA recombinase